MTSVFLILSLFTRGAPEVDLLEQIDDAGKKAGNFLIDRQNKDGGYGPQMRGKSDVGITALVVWALCKSPASYREWDGPFISAAVDFLLKHQKENGAIHDGNLWNYKTSISIMALKAVDAKKYAEQIDKAVAFTKSHQLTEDSRIPYDREEHVYYGGWGYGSTRKGDLSNTQLALEALNAGEVPKEDPVFSKAQVFLSRTQNLCDTNDAIKNQLIRGWGTNDDGGFMYRPGESKVEPFKLQDGTLHHSSYGSMTYAGIKSFIYAQLDRSDKRLQKAYRWVCKHYTVEKNPGLAVEGDPGSGKQGLYYYYRTMAKALLLWGNPEVPAPEGKRNWARDLAKKLISLQNESGSWVNSEDRWYEGIPEVSTTYAILALRDCATALKKWPLEEKPEKGK